jgi:hypothetical protein
MKHKYLRKTLTYYLAAGLIMNVVLLSQLLLGTYQNNLEELLARFSSVTINIVKIKNATGEMDRVMQAIDVLYPYDESLARRDALLQAADKIKSIVREGSMSLKEVSVQGNELVLPLEIALVTRNFVELVGLVGGMQSLAFPYSVIESMDLNSEDGSQLKCTIKAHLRMPADAGDINAAETSS